jgi:hypothetical protein
MSLQEEAKRIIELVFDKLDQLFRQYGFNAKNRQSDPSIFNEILSYEKGDIELRISACLHPHDYPNSLNITLIRKIPNNWQYHHLPNLFTLVSHKKTFTSKDLMIDPQINFSNTLSNLYEFCELVLREIKELRVK